MPFYTLQIVALIIDNSICCIERMKRENYVLHIIHLKSSF